MNIAVTTLILAILLLPGIIYRRFYYTEEFSKQYIRSNFFELFFSSLIPSIFFHSLWYFIIPIFGYRVDFKAIGNLLTNIDSTIVYQNINSYFPQIILYHFSIFSFSAIFGFSAKKVVRFFKLDRRRKIFRFKNSWHYLFSGEFFDFPRSAFDIIDNVDNIEYFYVDLISDTNEGTVIYEGFLVDYELSSIGGLEYIIIKEVERRYLKDDNVNKKYEIPGHILIIPYNSIINLNLTFYKLDINIMDNGEIKVSPILIE